MADHLTPEQRSAHMRRIRKQDTKPEMVVRRMIHALGLRFRLHRRDLPGTPDIVLPRHHKAVQVHGCFWHQHEGCPLARQPKTRLDYWQPKLRRNIERDRQALTALERAGWRCLIIWECQTRDADALRAILEAFLLRSRKL
jgi:DNA mismatch endonuclease (patch repair protein)